MMRFVPIIAAACVSVAQAWGAPMPKLPELPPLPSSYAEATQNYGTYAGVLGGYASGGETGTLGVILGHTVSAADLLLGMELITLSSVGGQWTFEVDTRLGVSLTQSLAAFGQVGLGATTDTGMFAAVGVSFDYDVSESLALRAQYQYLYDLSGEPPTHRVLGGALFRF